MSLKVAKRMRMRQMMMMMKVIVLCLDLCCAAVLPLLGSGDDGVGDGGGEVAK